MFKKRLEISSNNDNQEGFGKKEDKEKQEEELKIDPETKIGIEMPDKKFFLNESKLDRLNLLKSGGEGIVIMDLNGNLNFIDRELEESLIILILSFGETKMEN